MTDRKGARPARGASAMERPFFSKGRFLRLLATCEGRRARIPIFKSHFRRNLLFQAFRKDDLHVCENSEARISPPRKAARELEELKRPVGVQALSRRRGGRRKGLPRKPRRLRPQDHRSVFVGVPAVRRGGECRRRRLVSPHDRAPEEGAPVPLHRRGRLFNRRVRQRRACGHASGRIHLF